MAWSVSLGWVFHRLMSGRVIPIISGKMKGFPETAPPPIFLFLMVSLRTTMVPVGISRKYIF